jgi:hypothetical protein
MKHVCQVMGCFWMTPDVINLNLIKESIICKRLEILFFVENEVNRQIGQFVDNWYGDANIKMMCNYLYVI